ncbi:MAG TPA: hypothetical protein VK636_17820 [Gemmatimonadaceae bacterium]|nr:hypothetical protein [Gemmatimonadaceae bacterium]
MRTWLAPAHLALTIIIVIWDIVLAGRIAQNSQAPRVFQAVSGLAALLVFPGLLLALATTTIITGRAVVAMDWVWPAVLVLFAVQAVYALAKRLVNFAWGIPIMVYNVLIAAVGLIRYMVGHGYTPLQPLVTLLTAQSLAMVFATGTSGVLATQIYLNMPMVSPAFPARRGLTASFRLFMSLVAVMWCVFVIALGMPRAFTQLRNYDAHRRDPLRERPDGDFAIGLKILPDIAGVPSASAVKADSALVDTLDVDVVSVVVVPGATRVAIEALARALDPARRDSTVLIVAIGYRNNLVPELGRSPLNEAQRLATLRDVVARLHPDIVLPAEDPYGSGERALGLLPAARWQKYLTDAARTAKSVDRNVRIGVSASSYRTDDSTLYAWAASAKSPIDVVGFSLFPSPYIGGGIQSDTRTADRWMRATPSKKEHWVFATGGFPLAYGERSQEEAVWEVLAWATNHSAIKGAVVYEAGDYGQSRGLRAPNGRIRPAARSVVRALEQIRESAK